MAETIRVCIADDQELIRRGLRLILSSFEGVSVVGEAVDGQDAVNLVGRLKPDVVLMDIRMPKMDGIAATRSITHNPETRKTSVLILTTFDADEYVYDALAAGASGFLLKDCEPEELQHAIEVIRRGDALIAPSVTRRLVENIVVNHKGIRNNLLNPDALSSLTERELEIVAMVGRGMTNDEIAQSLVISSATVRTHVGRIMNKLDVHDRAQLVVVAYETGLVRPGM